MIDAFLEILKIPYLWQSLGIVSAISLFISPVLYNGDYKIASKSLIIIGGYISFVAVLNFFFLSLAKNRECEIWLQLIMLLILVGFSYALGLLLGIYIHNKVKKD